MYKYNVLYNERDGKKVVASVYLKCNIILPTIIIMTSGQQNSPFAAFCFLVAADTTTDDDDACPHPLLSTPLHDRFTQRPSRARCRVYTWYQVYVYMYKSHTRRRPAARHSTLLPTPNFPLYSVRAC